MFFRMFLGESLVGELFIGQGGVYNILLTKVQMSLHIYIKVIKMKKKLGFLYNSGSQSFGL